MNAVCKLIVLACLMIAGLACHGTAAEPEASSIRVGVYDSRAVAIAYAPSKFNPAREKMREFQQAKADGNKH